MAKPTEEYQLTGENETINGITYPIYKNNETGYKSIIINKLHRPTGMTPLQEKWHRKFGLNSKPAKLAMAFFLWANIIGWGTVLTYEGCKYINDSQKTQPAQVEDNTSQGLEQIIRQR